MNNITKGRMKKELEMFLNSPPSGISCVPVNDQLDNLSAQIIGASGTPFEGGVFHLEIQIPERYPFDPPRIRFLTPIYHPNIDTSGRICLDTLKLPPKGTWRPCLNISTVLMMIRVLMSEPGSEDPLMTEIWQEFKYDYTTYAEKAKQMTQLNAMNNNICKENTHLNKRDKEDTSSHVKSVLDNTQSNKRPVEFTEQLENIQNPEDVCKKKSKLARKVKK
ncbi:ubiquitin-conjugating enzyme E2 T-like [Physella acuta]|uniref:ubiquitin-conjugating enzyme E2 T-like n=1 Tax=Physella acuta TaxID=109671 RepID=UPI0027DC1759|nr:ubiquitin-conjugating enzyme E2 T-like [Physella acuta]